MKLKYDVKMTYQDKEFTDKVVMVLQNDAYKEVADDMGVTLREYYKIAKEQDDIIEYLGMEDIVAEDSLESLHIFFETYNIEPSEETIRDTRLVICNAKLTK